MFPKKYILITVLCIYLTYLYSFTSSERVNVAGDRAGPVKIAVVGGGIGGSSNAFFLRDLFGEDADITLFEKDTIGGRLATASIAGAEYEMGGSIIHPRNFYMKKFVQDFGLKRRKDGDDGTMAIYDGEEFVFMTSKYSIVTLLKMIWRYGLGSFRMSWTISNLLKKFERIYDLQDAGHSYTDIEGIMNAMGGEEFERWLYTPISSVLKDMGFSERFVRELAAIATRANYGQDPDMMGFAGMVSLAGAMPGLWSIEGGNKLVPEQLLQRSGARLVKAQIQSVERLTNGTSDRPAFRVTWNEGDQGVQNDDVFDIVMMATPIENDLSGIKFLGFDHPIKSNFTGDYRHTVSSLIQGRPRASTFGASPKGGLPGQIITDVEVPLGFRTLAKNFPVDYDPVTFNTSRQIYKVFSTGVLNDTQMEALFESFTEATHRDWLAYPYYHERKGFPGFVLAEGLFYPNAIEWAASAMEMGIIGSRNSAILAYQYWTGLSPKVKEGTSRVKQEL